MGEQPVGVGCGVQEDCLVIAPEELRHRQQWLLWRYEPNPKKPPGANPLKVPY